MKALATAFDGRKSIVRSLKTFEGFASLSSSASVRRHSVVLHCIRTIIGSGFAYARIYQSQQTFRSQ